MPAKARSTAGTASSCPASIAVRLAGCRATMAGRRLPGYLLTRNANTFYMTGFTGEDSAVLVTTRNVFIISDARFDLAIDQEVPWAAKRLRQGNNLLADEIAALCRELKLTRVGISPVDMTVEFAAKLRKLARPVHWVSAPPIANDLRVHKDASELKLMQEAVDIAEEAFLATVKTIRPGQTENELAARIEYEMRRRGSSAPAFPTIAAANANAAHPHAHAGNRKVTSGGLILFDWGATVGMYHSDLTRCLFVRKIPPKLGDVYGIVLEAQRAAIEAVRPGARMCDVDRTAREIIVAAGYEKQFVHGLGHGLGLDVHEAPSLSWRSKQRLEAGMVVTVEPGVYLQGLGGIRIEDDVLVTPTGRRVLSTLNKDLHDTVI